MKTYNIILPVFNAGSSLEECINSIISQTFSDWELLVMDDGSMDNSIDIVSSFNDKRIKVFQQNNRGAYSARNELLKKVDARYVAFIDADDTWKSDKLEKQLKIHNMGYDFTCGNMQITCHDCQLDKNNFSVLHNIKHGEVSLKKLLSHKVNFIVQSTVSIKWSPLRDIGSFVEQKLASDFIQWIRFLDRGDGKFFYDDSILGKYRLHENNISRDMVKKYDEFALGIDKIKNDLTFTTLKLVDLRIKRNSFLSALKTKNIYRIIYYLTRHPLISFKVFFDQVLFLIRIK